MSPPSTAPGTATYKVIVVGTDGSDRASIAVGEALALAKMSGATLHAVHVVDPTVKTDSLTHQRRRLSSR